MSCDDISIDWFLFFFFFTQHVITHISSRVAIILLRLFVLMNCQRLAKSYSHGEQINAESIFFKQFPKYWKDYCNNWKQPLGCVKKSRKTANWHAGNHFNKDMNYNIDFCKMNFSKYGLDGLSQCFPQFKMVYVFLKYFFQNISQIIIPNIYTISVKNKTTEIKLNKQKWWTQSNS